MTARQIIEARLGTALPATRDLAYDQRAAIRKLASQLLVAAAQRRQDEMKRNKDETQ